MGRLAHRKAIMSNNENIEHTVSIGCNPTGVDVSCSRRVFADETRGDWESSTGGHPYEDWLVYDRNVHRSHRWAKCWF